LEGCKDNPGPTHRVRQYMTLKRFQQLKRYLHVSSPENKNDPILILDPAHEPDENQYDPDLVGRIWWYKVEPLAGQFRSASRRLYTPPDTVAFGELMIRCFGRSNHTYKMPNKPISQGYKLYSLVDQGYIWWFVWSSRQDRIIEVPQLEGPTKTGSMVYHTIQRLPSNPGRFSIYMDNYFTSIPLFKKLRELGYGAYGTTRPSNYQ
jgi:hypothetical protein